MCFSREAALSAFFFHIVHIFLFGVLFNDYTGLQLRSAFAKRLRPNLLIFAVSWMMMQAFDSALWKTRDSENSSEFSLTRTHSCYELAHGAGYPTVAATMGSLVMFGYRWFQDFDSWTSVSFFASIVVVQTCLVMDMQEVGFPNLMKGHVKPYKTYGSNGELWSDRNKWYSDHPSLLPFGAMYSAPVLVHMYKFTQLICSGGISSFWDLPRFARLTFYLNLSTVVALVIAMLMNYFAWGSVWCLFSGFGMLIMDYHVLVSELYYGEKSKDNSNSCRGNLDWCMTLEEYVGATKEKGSQKTLKICQSKKRLSVSQKKTTR